MAAHPPADMILDEVSTTHALNWDDHSKLMLACQYIDNQRDPQAFEDFCEQQAAAELEEEIET